MNDQPCPCCGHDQTAVEMVIKDEFEENEALKAKGSTLEAENADLKESLGNVTAHEAKLIKSLHDMTERFKEAKTAGNVAKGKVSALEARCAGLERERDAAIARDEAAEEALRLARERQGKRLEWIWDGLRAICAMDPNTEAERMQQWASDTLYGAATPEEWEPDVRAVRMEEFKRRPPIAGHAPATPQPNQSENTPPPASLPDSV